MGRLEQVAVLQTIDDKWREHLREMDDLREGIHLRAYGQKDPILEYKGEAYKLFMDLIKEINIDSVQFAFKYFPQIIRQPQITSEEAARTEAKVADDVPKLRRSSGAMSYQHSSHVPDYLKQELSVQQPEGAQAGPMVKTIRNVEPKIGRNDTVKVKYRDGKVMEAKFKKVELDVAEGKCQIIK
jgi:preprotein translocase subunit SecA